MATLPYARGLLLASVLCAAGCAGTIGRGPAHARGGLDPVSLLPEDTKSIVWIDVAAIERWPVTRLAQEDWADVRERIAALEDDDEDAAAVLPTGDEAEEDEPSAFETFEAIAQAEWALFASMPGEQEDDGDELIVLYGPFDEDNVEQFLRSFDPPLEFEAPDSLGGLLPFGGGASSSSGLPTPGDPSVGTDSSQGPPPVRPEPTLERDGRLFVFGDSAAVELRENYWVFGTGRRVRAVVEGPRTGLPSGPLRDMWERVDGSGAIAIAGDVSDGELIRALESGEREEGEGPRAPAVAQHTRALGLRLRLRGDLRLEAYLATESRLSATVVVGELQRGLDEAADNAVTRVLGITRALRDATIELDSGGVHVGVVVEEARVTAMWGRIAGIGTAIVEVIHLFSSFMSGLGGGLGGETPEPPGPGGFEPQVPDSGEMNTTPGPGSQEL